MRHASNPSDLNQIKQPKKLSKKLPAPHFIFMRISKGLEKKLIKINLPKILSKGEPMEKTTNNAMMLDIPKEIWKHPKLSLCKKLVWGEIYRAYDSSIDGCSLSTDKIMENLNLPRTTINHAILDMCELNLMSKSGYKSKNRIVKAYLPGELEKVKKEKETAKEHPITILKSFLVLADNYRITLSKKLFTEYGDLLTYLKFVLVKLELMKLEGNLTVERVLNGSIKNEPINIASLKYLRQMGYIDFSD